MATTSDQALNDLRAFQGSRRKSTDILREQETSLGVPSAQQRQAGLRAAISNTENLLRAVEPSVAGRTSGVNVTEAQKTRLVGLERQPLDESFREQSRALEGETANLSDIQRRALQQSQLQLSEDDQRESSLQGLYGNLYQREQDALAKAERDRAFQEQQRQARMSEASQRSMADLLRGGGGGSTAPKAAAPAVNKDMQWAAASVKKFAGKGDTAIRSDYEAAKRYYRQTGSEGDRYKVMLYEQQFPQLFGRGVSADALMPNLRGVTF